MNGRTILGLATFAVIAIGVCAYFWVHPRAHRINRAIASMPELTTATRAATREIPPPNPRAATTERPVPRQPAKAAPEPEPVRSARPGEELDFAADVSKLTNVATLRLQVLDQRDFFGKTAWHLQAFAHTENPLRMVLELDDQFDSYSDAGTLSSLQYEMHLKEHGEKVDSVQRMVAGNTQPAPANVTATRVLPGTRDPLGFMQYLRDVDWSKSREVQSPVYDGHKLYEVRASLAATSETVSVPAGTFAASKVDIHVFDNGTEMKDAQFALYLANTAAHTPVLLEAVLPFATARVQLIKAK